MHEKLVVAFLFEGVEFSLKCKEVITDDLQNCSVAQMREKSSECKVPLATKVENNERHTIVNVLHVSISTREYHGYSGGTLTHLPHCVTIIFDYYLNLLPTIYSTNNMLITYDYTKYYLN